MKIKELIDNKTFCFNVNFRIYQYIPLRHREGRMILKYDSMVDEWKDEDGLFDHEISAVNQSSTGTVEIEYCD